MFLSPRLMRRFHRPRFLLMLVAPSRLVSLSLLLLARSLWFLVSRRPRFLPPRPRLLSPHLMRRFRRLRFLPLLLMLVALNRLVPLSRLLLVRSLWFLVSLSPRLRFRSLRLKSLSPHLMLRSRRPRFPLHRHMLRLLLLWLRPPLPWLRYHHPRFPPLRHTPRFRLPRSRSHHLRSQSRLLTLRLLRLWSRRLWLQSRLLPSRLRRPWYLVRFHQAQSLRQSAPIRHALLSRLLLDHRPWFLSCRLWSHHLLLRARHLRLQCRLPSLLEKFPRALLLPCPRLSFLEKSLQAQFTRSSRRAQWLQCPRPSFLDRSPRAPPLPCPRLSSLEKLLRARLTLSSLPVP
jgi:hypothetical protein